MCMTIVCGGAYTGSTLYFLPTKHFKNGHRFSREVNSMFLEGQHPYSLYDAAPPLQRFMLENCIGV